MAQAVSRRPLTAEALVRSLSIPCGFCIGQSGNGIGFLFENFGFYLSVSLHNFPTFICFVILLFSNGRASEAWVPESSAFSGRGDTLDRNEISH
jgi:hypothetical protein